MIHSRDVILNERVTYKDRDNKNTSNSKQSGLVYTEVDDVPETPMIETPQLEESIKNNNEQQVDTPEPSTLAPVLRRSSRPHMPNRKYLNYILLANEGELENYKETC